MIQIQTKVKIRDNTGVKYARCIKVYRGLSAKIGDIILVSVTLLKKRGSSKIKISKGNLFQALVVRTAYNHKQSSGTFIKFNENSVVLLNNKKEIMGTRILGPIPRDLRKVKHLKIISLSSNII
jgi:large subunit ribosomal protein L14